MLLLLLSCVPKNPPPPSVQVETFEYVWKLVGQVYPDPDMGGVDWRAVHDELLPKAQEAETADQLRPTLGDMIGRLEVSHFAVYPGTKHEPEFSSVSSGDPRHWVAQDNSADVGIEVRFVDGALLVTRVRSGSAAAEAGVQAGWTIHSIDGTQVSVQLGEQDPEDPEVQGTMARAASKAFRGAAGESLSLVALTPEGEQRPLELERRATPGEVVQVGFMPPMTTEFEAWRARGDVGVLRFNVFMPPVAPQAEAALSELAATEAPGVVFDLRGNPGGVLAIGAGLAGYLVDERSSLGTMISRDGDLNLVVFPRPPAQRIDGPVAILVDELSFSTSEVLAHGLQATGRARVFGTPTVGACLPSTVDILPNGDRLQYVLADLVGPTGVRIEGVGVTPDEIIPVDIDALKAGQDPVLEAALCWILEDCE